MSDLHARVLDLVGDVSALLDVGDFCDGLFAALRSAVPCDYVSLNQVASEPERNWSIVDPPLSAYYHDTFYRLALQNPLAERFLRTRDGRPLRLSDISTPDQFHGTALYEEFYAPLGVEHQIAFALPGDRLYILAIALSRREHDFTDRERDLLLLARPHLIQAYRNALRFSEPQTPPPNTQPGPQEPALQALGLTPTQAHVLRLIATGRSTTDIARDLRIAQRTVHKHLQHTYTKLGVTNRSAAAHRAWQTTAQPEHQPPTP